MSTAEKLLGALEAERMAIGYYREAGAAAAAMTVEQPDFASVDPSQIQSGVNFHDAPTAEVVA
jgi:hypothetical protein